MEGGFQRWFNPTSDESGATSGRSLMTPFLSATAWSTTDKAAKESEIYITCMLRFHSGGGWICREQVRDEVSTFGLLLVRM
jgi:hypothetical protein